MVVIFLSMKKPVICNANIIPMLIIPMADVNMRCMAGGSIKYMITPITVGMSPTIIPWSFPWEVRASVFTFSSLRSLITFAMERVVKAGETGPMRDEFEKFLQDLRLGVSLRDALEGLAERTDLYEIRSFTSALIQADKMGTPLGDVLRIQSEIRRRERFQKAEKLAQESPVKMLFPLILFIFPAVFIIILVPIMLKFMAEGM